MARSSRNKAVWYWNRLRSMSAAEIVYRAVEASKRRADLRHRSSLGQVAIPQAAKLPEIPSLIQSFGTGDIPSHLLVEWRALAERAISGKFTFLGRNWPSCQADRRWHLDPTTSKAWPSDRYCFDIDYRHASEYGDVKYVWELNRLQ